MVKVNPLQDKDFESKGATWFEAGVHEVYITSAERGTATTGSEYIQFELLGEGDATGNTRLYLTDKTAERSISIMGGIAVHNKQGDVEKQKVRDAFKKIVDTDQINEAFLAKFKDMQAWILTEEDTNGAQKPNGGYYLRSNLYSYEPKPRQAAPSTTQTVLGGEEINLADIPF